jgi:hypothetical protein
MGQVARRRWLIFLLMLLLIGIGETVAPEQAEAGFFRRLFGGRGRPGMSRMVRRRGGGNRRFVARNNFAAHRNNFNRNNFDLNNFNNFNRFDTDFLGRFPVDGFSDLRIDPTGAFSRVAGTRNVAVDRFGNFFEITGGAVLEVRQPLLRSNGQLVGGATFGTVFDDTVNDMRFLNSRFNNDFLRGF